MVLLKSARRLPAIAKEAWYRRQMQERIKKRREKEKKKPGMEALSLQNCFWLFFFGSIIGFILEGAWAILRVGVWENHASTVWGPFCIVYGIGAVAMFSIAALVSHCSRILQFFIYATVGSGVEFFASLLQEKVFGSISWDYTDHAFDLFGRASLQMALIWGGLGVLFASFVFPHLPHLLRRMRGRGWAALCIVLALFMVVNLVVTALAILRWRERMEELPPSGAVDLWLDRRYGDEKMTSVFSNMVFKEHKKG